MGADPEIVDLLVNLDYDDNGVVIFDGLTDDQIHLLSHATVADVQAAMEQNRALAEMHERAAEVHKQVLAIMKSQPWPDGMVYGEWVETLPADVKGHLLALTEEGDNLGVLLGVAPTTADLEEEVAAGRMEKIYRADGGFYSYRPIPGAGCRWETP